MIRIPHGHALVGLLASPEPFMQEARLSSSSNSRWRWNPGFLGRFAWLEDHFAGRNLSAFPAVIVSNAILAKVAEYFRVADKRTSHDSNAECSQGKIQTCTFS
jgi:hypothetical protein